MMQILFFLINLLIYVLADETAVHVYTDDNFDELTDLKSLDNKDIHVIVFHASWCPHCQNFLPVFESVAESITKEENEPNIIFGTVETSENTKLKKRFLISSIPAIYIFKNRRVYHYQEDRTAEKLLTFLKTGMTSIPKKQWLKFQGPIKPPVNYIQDLLTGLENLESESPTVIIFLVATGFILGAGFTFFFAPRTSVTVAKKEE